MADTAKYAPINGGTLITDLKTHFSFRKTKRTVACAYGFVFVFIGITIFLAFSPSPNSSSPWFTNVFSLTSSSSSSSGSSSTSTLSDESGRSHFSSIYSYFFPNSSQQVHNFRSQNSPFEPREPQIGKNKTLGNVTTPISSSGLNNQSSVVKNQPQSKDFDDKVGVLKANQSIVGSETVNQKENSVPRSSSSEKNANGNTKKKEIAENGVMRNFTSSLVKKHSSNGTNVGVSVKKIDEDLVKSLLNCDLFDGNWVTDESYPLYKPGSCSLIDEQFNCFINGRPDSSYLKMKWKPKSCTLPRLNGTHMLELLRGKRLVFVGDSLNRNMWESLVCILRNSVKDQKKVYEEFGRLHFRTEALYSFIFEEYNCRVEFFVSPFLVQEWEVSDKGGIKKETLRLDLIGQSADKYKNADIIVFNTGHWWTHEKTSLGKDYYQEGSHVYNELNVLEAFRKALTTWGRWIDAHVNPKKTFVLFRGYSASHFSGGQWNSGGACDHETEPIKNDTYLTSYPSKMMVLEKVLKGMKTKVSYLNITRMSDYRKDAHPSVYRKQNLTDEERKSPLRFQDCSHWCLPGVPDAWNELLYAELLVKQHQKQQEKEKP